MRVLILLGFTIFLELVHACEILVYQADIDIPIVQNFLPDQTFHVYRYEWKVTDDYIFDTLRKGAIKFFASHFDVNFEEPSCSQSQSNSWYCVEEDGMVSGVLHLRRRSDNKAVAKIWHVDNPPIVGYKLVHYHSKDPWEGAECPIQVKDTAWVLDAFEDRKRIKAGETLYYGWYTLDNLKGDGHTHVINYSSLVALNTKALWSTLRWNLKSDTLGDGFTDGYVYQPKKKLGYGGGGMLPGFSIGEMRMTRWRNVLKLNCDDGPQID